ncbi:MAG: mannitol dehydrogenase family protein, partial [Solirubrobacterales bacterium]|nr:mannitol dehydrogenase family protein [Solirubrobacterales bacterium]
MRQPAGGRRRLTLASLASLPLELAPPVDPRSLRARIVHLGLGAFHRAHQALFTEDAVAATGEDWGICGVSPRSGHVVEQLAPQDGLYTVATRAGRQESLRVVGVVRELLWARADPDRVTARIAAPATTLVTLTVTEKGYRHDPASNRLRLEDREIAADLAGEPPRTVIGQLVAGLERRRRDTGEPLTILCCDNLPSNGRVLEGLVHEFVARREDADELAGWIDRRVRFPSTMVDRIVPASTRGDLLRVAARLGLIDEGVVVTEPFRQWVIEDDFVAPRPAWEKAGATLTADVGPYERIKLRMLNASHSTIAYLGALADCELAADAMREDRPFRALAHALMVADVAPTLQLPDGFDLDDYRGQLLDRFANPALRHRTIQIAMDGSQKLPQRLLGTIRDRLAQGAEPAVAALGVAAWMRFVSARRTDGGRALAVDDPLADRIAQTVGEHEDPVRVVDALLSLREVFGEQLAADQLFRAL